MARTPPKTAQWNLDFSDSLGSPFIDAPSTDSVTSTSTLQYVNSQLIAHGFAHSPGLSLDGLSNGDSEKVVKCLFGMLSQRMIDMNRTEELTTKLRTLSYDHERLTSMHHTATEKVESAERETNLFKSRLASAARTIQQAEAAHKHTTGELQRTRSSLQALRAAHQTELKKKDKDIERMSERWSKLSDTQLKLGSVGSGMTVRSSNSAIVEGRPDAVLGRGKGLVETALDEAEKASRELREENGELKALIVDVTNAIQKILHKALGGEPDDDNQPTPLGIIDLFPLGPVDVAFERLSSLLTSLRSTVATILETRGSDAAAPTDNSVDEIEKLQQTITTLRSELEKAKESPTYKAKAKAIFDRDEEKERLDQKLSEVEAQKTAFTEAVTRLGKERAEFQAERMKFLEEKRSWGVQSTPTEPDPASTAPDVPTFSSEPDSIPPEPMTPSRKSPRKSKVKISSPRKSPRRSPAKVKTRTFRRVSSTSGVGLPPSSHFVPSYETEVIPSTSLMPTSFVLPPPSPQSRFPPRTSGILGAFNEVEPLKLDLPRVVISEEPAPQRTSRAEDVLEGISEPLPDTSSKPSHPRPSLSAAPTHSTDMTDDELLAVPAPVPKTPRAFPVAKPFAQRMIHAYSPAKPSPLSRILMLSDSPEGDLGTMHLKDLVPMAGLTGAEVNPSSAFVLPEEDDDNPLLEKRADQTANAQGPQKTEAATKTAAPARDPVKKSLAPALEKERDRTKGKDKAKTAAPTATTRSKTPTGVGEKENVTKRAPKASTSKVPPASSAATAKTASVATSQPAAVSIVTTRGKFGASNKLPPGKSGPRRVPIDSAEAALPIGPGWRG